MTRITGRVEDVAFVIKVWTLGEEQGPRWYWPLAAQVLNLVIDDVGGLPGVDRVDGEETRRKLSGAAHHGLRFSPYQSSSGRTSMA